jgi:hypothetical protein
MPYAWVPAPSDPKLKVIKSLPKGAEVFGKTASLGDKTWHKCYGCGGWIEGDANEYHEDTIGPLCGRRGRSSHCRRCGLEIDFFGAMS